MEQGAGRADRSVILGRGVTGRRISCPRGPGQAASHTGSPPPISPLHPYLLSCKAMLMGDAGSREATPTTRGPQGGTPLPGLPQLIRKRLSSSRLPRKPRVVNSDKGGLWGAEIKITGCGGSPRPAQLPEPGKGVTVQPP